MVNYALIVDCCRNDVCYLPVATENSNNMSSGQKVRNLGVS